MSARVKRQIAVERELLHQLIETHHSVLVKCATEAPNPIELSALAAMLHACYSSMQSE